MIKKLESEEKMQETFEKAIEQAVVESVVKDTEPVVKDKPKMDPTAISDTYASEVAYKKAVDKLIGVDSEMTGKPSNVPSAVNNGGSTDYYKLHKTNFTHLQDIIESVDMNFAMGNIFKAAYRFYTKTNQTKERIRDLNKIIYFAERERDRLNNG